MIVPFTVPLSFPRFVSVSQLLVHLMSRFTHIDALRGIAALMVCWFHMTHGGKLLGKGAAAEISSLGFLGVEAFFVISGFVIPLSMWRTGYRWADFGGFFVKRMLRVHPPFVAACVLALGLNFASSRTPGFAGNVSPHFFQNAAVSLLSDSTYLSGVLGRQWLLVVAWTLFIEVQFYLLAGLLLPVVRLERPRWLAVGLVGLACTAWMVTDSRWLFAYLPYFCLGWAAAWYQMAGSKRVLPWLAMVGVVAVLFAKVSLAAAVAAVASAAFILFWKLRLPRAFAFLGTISFSLYLVHVPLGGRVVNLLGRYGDSGIAIWGIIILATMFSLAAAWLFWRYVENPCHQWSRRWRAGAKQQPEPAVPQGT
ncbi:MAG: acyltransferase [Verrucomicrobiales bacterium]|nr:acyltransferase [Verrucomicrobiales bacterium]